MKNNRSRPSAKWIAYRIIIDIESWNTIIGTIQILFIDNGELVTRIAIDKTIFLLSQVHGL